MIASLLSEMSRTWNVYRPAHGGLPIARPVGGKCEDGPEKGGDHDVPHSPPPSTLYLRFVPEPGGGRCTSPDFPSGPGRLTSQLRLTGVAFSSVNRPPRFPQSGRLYRTGKIRCSGRGPSEAKPGKREPRRFDRLFEPRTRGPATGVPGGGPRRPRPLSG